MFRYRGGIFHTESKVISPPIGPIPVSPHAPQRTDSAALCFLTFTGLRPHDCHELRSVVLPWPSMRTCELPGFLLVLRWVLPEERS